MFSKEAAVGHVVFAVILGSAALLGQQTPAPGSPVGLEFPVVMRQNVAAGKNPVGTKVQANLVISTLVDGVVIPRDAVLSGEVTESVAKTKTDPCRLAIRMDSVQWKNGSAPIKLYSESIPRFPGPDSGKDSSSLPPPSYITSKHRVLMKDVDSIRNSDGAVTLTSSRTNLKIDKLTTYVLAKDGLLPAK
jgi:hypothetical protein